MSDAQDRAAGQGDDSVGPVALAWTLGAFGVVGVATWLSCGVSDTTEARAVVVQACLGTAASAANTVLLYSAIRLQRRDLRMQRTELELQRREIIAQRKELELTRAVHEEQLGEARRQGDLARAQQLLDRLVDLKIQRAGMGAGAVRRESDRHIEHTMRGLSKLLCSSPYMDDAEAQDLARIADDPNVFATGGEPRRSKPAATPPSATGDPARG